MLLYGFITFLCNSRPQFSLEQFFSFECPLIYSLNSPPTILFICLKFICWRILGQLAPRILGFADVCGWCSSACSSVFCIFCKLAAELRGFIRLRLDPFGKNIVVLCCILSLGCTQFLAFFFFNFSSCWYFMYWFFGLYKMGIFKFHNFVSPLSIIWLPGDTVYI